MTASLRIDIERLVPSVPGPLSFPLSHDLVDRLSRRWTVSPTVSASTIDERIERLRRKNLLDGTNILKAISLADDEYQAWRAERKTVVIVDGRRGYLSHIHESLGPGSITLNALRMRLKKLASQGDISAPMLISAVTLNQARWQAKVGSGRSRAFIYTGVAFPEQQGKHFASVSWFLESVGKANLKSTVHSRLKNGWELDDAVLEPILTERGRIYLLTSISSGVQYVGLTTSSIERRFTYHARAPASGSASPLHEAIRRLSAADFRVELIEEVEDEALLAKRERYWIVVLDTLHPNGLNKRKGGQLGGFHGKRTIHNGRIFPSLAKAARTASEELGVPLHVAHTRLAKGMEIPSKPRAVKSHSDAKGSSPLNDLWRIHKSLLRRVDQGLVDYQIDDQWRDYNTFKRDVLLGRSPNLRLAQDDPNRPLGPENFR